MSAQAQMDPGTLAAHLEALAHAAQAVAEDLRNGLAAGSESRPVEPVDRPDLMTAQEVADALRVDVRTLRRNRHLGKAPKPLKGKGPLRWRRSDVDRWIEEGRS